MIVAYPLNAPSAAASFFGLVTVIASATGQTEFAIQGGYTPGAIVVFLNGSSLAPAHYTATNGTTVVLASGTGVVVGSELVVMRLSAFQVADALPLGGTAADSSKLGGQPPEFYLGGGSWGSITGTLANQADLQTALNSKASSADIDFTIIYPNGGSAASPATVALYSRYVISHPFPGHRVLVEAEFLTGGVWHTAKPLGVQGVLACGAECAQIGDSIILQTSSSHLIYVTGGWVNSTAPAGTVTGALPCRIKVWKVKGAIA
jgi:hypothetical protein